MLSRNFAWKLSASGMGGGVLFAFWLLAMRQLGPTDFGVVSLAISWAGLFAILVDFGFNPLISRDLSRYPHKGRSYFVHISLLKLASALLAALVMTVSLRFYDKTWSAMPLIVGAYVVATANSFVEMGQAFSYAYEQFRQGAFLSLIYKLSTAVCGLMGLIVYAGPAGLLYGMAFGAVLGAAATGLFYVRHLFEQGTESFSSDEARQLMAAALPVLIQNVLIVIYFRIDTILLAHWMGDLQTGLYNSAYRFFEVSNIIPTALIAATVARLSRAVHHPLWGQEFVKTLGLFVGAGLVCAAILCGISYALPQFILTPAFEPTGALLRRLSLGLLFYYPNFLLTSVLVLLERAIVNVWVAAVCVLFNIVANCLLIPRWGATGAAWTTVATESVIFGLSLWAIWRTAHRREVARTS